jgi:putative ABC transport system permease protein
VAGAPHHRADLRGDLAAGMRQRGARPGRGTGWTLVAVEIALATVLVIGAGLLLSSVARAPLGGSGIRRARRRRRRARRAVRLRRRARRVEFYDRLTQRLAALQGVRGVGAIHLTPVTRGNWSFPYLAEGMEAPEGPLPDANFRVVTPTYFDAVDQPLLRGRAFTQADRAPDAPWVGMINRTLAERLWPGEDPTGRVIKLFGSQPFTVVGVVGDVRQSALDVDPEPRCICRTRGAGACPP